MIEVVALGELLIDFATRSIDPNGYPTMVAHPGGAPSNFLTTLSHYGTRTALLGKVGNDDFGSLLIATLKRHGVETRGVRQDDGAFTTLAFVNFDDKGERSFNFARKPGADTQLRFEELDLGLIDQARVFHFGSLSLTDEPARTATQKAVAYARERGKLITFDPNLRRPLWASEELARQQILWGLHQTDVVKISDEEAAFLWDGTPEENADRLLDDCGVQLVLMTLGSKGCYLKNRQAACRLRAPQVHPVDTSGAGDIFAASAVSGLLRLGKAPGTLTEDELREVGRFAVTAASISTERSGAIPSIPERADVLARMV